MKNVVITSSWIVDGIQQLGKQGYYDTAYLDSINVKYEIITKEAEKNDSKD